MALGVHFENCGSLCDHFPGLLFFLVIYVKLGKEGLGITLVLDVYKSSLEVLSEGQIIVSVYLVLWISYSSTDL